MRRPNYALRLALPLLLGLILLLLLPLLTDLADPHLGVLVQTEGGKYRLPPFSPGEFGYRLGSDVAGRDLLSRVVYGARITLGLALVINLLRFLVALPLGLWSSWRGGWPARLVHAASVGFGAIPTLVLVAITLTGLRLLLPGQTGWMSAYVGMLVLTGAPRMAEQIRRRAEEILLQPHVEAAEAVGAKPGRLLGRHVLPLMKADLLVMAASEMAFVLLLMAQLAVFGVFVGGTIRVTGDVTTRIVEYLPEWGQMLGANRGAILRHPWIPFYPGLALGLAATTFHLLAEGLRVRGLRR